MSFVILVPLIMVVATGSVVGIRALYNHMEGKGADHSRIEELTKNVEERTRELANNNRK